MTPLPSRWVSETSGSTVDSHRTRAHVFNINLPLSVFSTLPPYLSTLIAPYISSLKVSQGHFSSCLSILAGTSTAPLHISPLLADKFIASMRWESARCKATNPFRQSESFRERKLAWIREVQRKECERNEGLF